MVAPAGRLLKRGHWRATSPSQRIVVSNPRYRISMSATEIPGYGKSLQEYIHAQERSRLYYAHAYFGAPDMPLVPKRGQRPPAHRESGWVRRVPAQELRECDGTDTFELTSSPNASLGGTKAGWMGPIRLWSLTLRFCSSGGLTNKASQALPREYVFESRSSWAHFG